MYFLHSHHQYMRIVIPRHLNRNLVLSFFFILVIIENIEWVFTVKHEVVLLQLSWWLKLKLLKNIKLNRNQNGCAETSMRVDTKLSNLFFSSLENLWSFLLSLFCLFVFSQKQYRTENMTNKAGSNDNSCLNQIGPIFPYKTLQHLPRGGLAVLKTLTCYSLLCLAKQ